MNATSAKTETISIWEVVKAKLAEAGAWLVANSAMLIGIGLIASVVAGIALLVVGIVKMCNAGKGKSAIEKKLDNINKEINETQKQLSEVNSSLKEIGDKKSELKTLTQEFQQLSNKSEDWRQKLSEINSQVLSLI